MWKWKLKKKGFTIFIQGLIQGFNQLAPSEFERRQVPSLAERYCLFLTRSPTQLTGHIQVYFSRGIKD